MNEQTQQATAPFFALVLVAAGPAYAVGTSPVGGVFGAAYGELAAWVASWIGA